MTFLLFRLDIDILCMFGLHVFVKIASIAKQLFANFTLMFGYMVSFLMFNQFFSGVKSLWAFETVVRQVPFVHVISMSSQRLLQAERHATTFTRKWLVIFMNGDDVPSQISSMLADF